MSEPGDVLGLGWHFRLPMHVYLSDPGISSSILKLAGDAPALAKAALDGEFEDHSTKASIEGELIHTALLEPDELNERYVISGKCAAKLGSGKRKGEECGAAGKAIDPAVGWVCGRHGGDSAALAQDDREVVTSSQWRMAINIRDNALVEDRPLFHPDAKRILESPGEPELTGIFRDTDTHERGRIRIDRYLEMGWSIDVKTTEVGVGAADRFVRLMWNRGMHVQQGWYSHGSGILDRPISRHVLLIAERGFPFVVQPYILPPKLVEYGKRTALDHLSTLAKCRASGEWPGYSDQIEEIALLGWQKAIVDRLPNEPDAEPLESPPMDFGIF